MELEILRPEKDAAPTSSAEVEFALVLSRMIDSVKNDPEHLRATVYELARYKLQEQLWSEKTADTQQLSKSLEVAIQGVETFVTKNDRNEAWLGRPALERPTPHVLAIASALQGAAPTSLRQTTDSRTGYAIPRPLWELHAVPSCVVIFPSTDLPSHKPGCRDFAAPCPREAHIRMSAARADERESKARIDAPWRGT